MTRLGEDILLSMLGNAATVLLVPGACRPVLTIRHEDGTIEQRPLGAVAIIPVTDMPSEFKDLQEIVDDGSKAA